MKYLVPVMVAALISVGAYRYWQLQSIRAVPVEGPRFVTPLGVIPLKDNVRITPDLRNGFVRQDSQDPRFRTKLMISLSADRIESFVKALAPVLLPEQAYAILNYTRVNVAPRDTTETLLTPFTERDPLIAGLQPYMFRLIHDGNVAFGLAWYDRTRHEEIFVNQKKIITVMTSRDAEVEAVLHRFAIEPFQEPKFITAYETANGDLRSFADLFPEEYGQYRSVEFLTAAYIPGLIQKLNFQKNGTDKQRP
jgi:hypothetical protein